MQPLPAAPYEISNWVYNRKVAANSHVSHGKNHYLSNKRSLPRLHQHSRCFSSKRSGKSIEICPEASIENTSVVRSAYTDGVVAHDAPGYVSCVLEYVA